LPGNPCGSGYTPFPSPSLGWHFAPFCRFMLFAPSECLPHAVTVSGSYICGATAQGLGTEVSHWGLGAKPRYGSGDKAPRS